MRNPLRSLEDMLINFTVKRSTRRMLHMLEKRTELPNSYKNIGVFQHTKISYMSRVIALFFTANLLYQSETKSLEKIMEQEAQLFPKLVKIRSDTPRHVKRMSFFHSILVGIDIL